MCASTASSLNLCTTNARPRTHAPTVHPSPNPCRPQASTPTLQSPGVELKSDSGSAAAIQGAAIHSLGSSLQTACTSLVFTVAHWTSFWPLLLPLLLDAVTSKAAPGPPSGPTSPTLLGLLTPLPLLLSLLGWRCTAVNVLPMCLAVVSVLPM
jgi:hypothetical protein